MEVAVERKRKHSNRKKVGYLENTHLYIYIYRGLRFYVFYMTFDYINFYVINFYGTT